MLEKLEFVKEHRCFKKGDTLSFRPGVNLLVGEQGSGKSTVLQTLIASDKKIVKIKSKRCTFMALDFEKDNPRNAKGFHDKIPMMGQLAIRFSSHGEVVLALLKTMREKNVIFFMDEPDMALSIRSCSKLVQLMKDAVKNNCQVVAAVHNPIVIQAFDDVLSLDHRKWISSDDFVKSHLE